jgi:hypothetical protein
MTVFEPMYLEVLNNNMVGFVNITAPEIMDHLFMTYSNITAVDLENNFEQMRRAWDPQQPVESCSKKSRVRRLFRGRRCSYWASSTNQCWDMQKSLQLGTI